MSALRDDPRIETIEVTGEVFAANLRQRMFDLWVDESLTISASFSEAQEDLVTSALRDHHTVRVFVRGRAELSEEGRPVRFVEVEQLRTLTAADETDDAETPPIEARLAAISARVPSAEWTKLPADLTDQIDHYLYGTPKR